jgi:acyl-CoA reductase-like NAD-dependent aldehyde dehydrogenase
MNYGGEPVPERIPVTLVGTDSRIQVAVIAAMNAARAAQRTWSQTRLTERLRLVRELRRLIAEHASTLAQASSASRNRPVHESLVAEVMPLAEACRFLELNARRLLAPRRLGKRGRPLWLAGVQTEIHREPLGVVLIIAPGNYPLLLPGVQLIQALVAGNSVLLKPGVGGTGVAAELCELLFRAGFDPRLVGLLPESPEYAVAAITAHPDKVLFTGAALTGEKILSQLAPQLIPSTMELSGCDGVIIRADADLALAVKALIFGLKLNGGATCMAPKRVFVSAARATELEGRLASELRDNLTLVTSTPRLRLLLEEALSRGAHFISGGMRNGQEILAPLVLGGVTPQCELLREDSFAPVLAVLTVDDDHEAVLRLNDCPFRLTASIFSADEIAARELATRLNVGAVTINDLIIPTADARVPFAGRGRSGFGVTRGAEGFLELTTVKVLTVTWGRFRPAFDEPQPGDTQMVESYLKLAHGKGLLSRWHAVVSLIRTLLRRKPSSSKQTI